MDIKEPLGEDNEEWGFKMSSLLIFKVGLNSQKSEKGKSQRGMPK